jgi:hypothetical protein
MEDEALDLKARAAAERLGLAYERRFTGLGGLDAFLPRSPAPDSGVPADGPAHDRFLA